ncbi:MAG: response regulator [Planctomycetota bacterium]
MQDGKYVILCIDDDPDIRVILRKVLEAAGHVCVVAAGAKEGLHAYKSVRPDLVIVDLMMEEIDSGAAFVRDLALLDNTAPVCMLSSVGDELAMNIDAESLGLAAVFQKPVDAARLVASVKAQLG